MLARFERISSDRTMFVRSPARFARISSGRTIRPIPCPMFARFARISSGDRTMFVRSPARCSHGSSGSRVVARCSYDPLPDARTIRAILVRSTIRPIPCYSPGRSGILARSLTIAVIGRLSRAFSDRGSRGVRVFFDRIIIPALPANVKKDHRGSADERITAVPWCSCDDRESRGVRVFFRKIKLSLKSKFPDFCTHIYFFSTHPTIRKI